MKCMSFQLGTGEVAQILLRHAGRPPLFPLRDPVLTIESRLRRVLSDMLRASEPRTADQDRITKALETAEYAAVDDLVSDTFLSRDQMGLDALEAHVDFCRREKIPFLLVDTERLRASPETTVPILARCWKLQYEEPMIRWRRETFPDHGVLPEQSAWFERVSRSSGFEQPTERPIPVRAFPEKLQATVTDAVAVFEDLRTGPENVL